MIEPLEWDSAFFGYPVGRLSLNLNENIHEEKLVQDAAMFKLVYVISENEINIGGNGLQLADIKITLVKENLNKQDVVDSNVSTYKGEMNIQLLELALQSGEYSRFRTDVRFQNHEFERLYQQWMESSIYKTLANDVIVYKENEIIQGMVTVANQPGYAEIGLLGVDRNSRGKGIGTSLLSYVNNFAIQNGLKKIKVITQLNNSPAMHLYEKAGFAIADKKYIYHLWN